MPGWEIFLIVVAVLAGLVLLCVFFVGFALRNGVNAEELAEAEKSKAEHVEHHHSEGVKNVTFHTGVTTTYGAHMSWNFPYEVCDICGEMFFTVPPMPPIYNGGIW